MRLTNAMREAIRDKIIAHRFTKEARQLFKEYSVLAGRVYDVHYPAPMRRNMATLPKGWLPEATKLMFTAGQSVVSLQLNGTPERSGRLRHYDRDIKEITMRFLAKDMGRCLLVLEADHSIAVELEKLNQRKTTIYDTENESRRSVDIALDKFYTVEKLIEGWPEVEPFTVGVVPAKPAPPVVQTTELNVLLDLPVRDATPSV